MLITTVNQNPECECRRPRTSEGGQYLDVGGQARVDPQWPQHGGQRGGGGEGGGDSVTHCRQRENLEAKLLVLLLQLLVGLLVALAEDAAHRVATLLCRPLTTQTQRERERSD